MAGLVTLAATASAMAASVPTPTKVAKVSFTFDDGYASAITQAAPTLVKYGFSGTSYVATGCVGMTTAPNTCRANNDANYMTWDQITQLKNTYGWEIGSHTKTHPYLATSDASDGQPQKLTSTQVIQELTQAKADLAAHGISATNFASPYGDYNPAVLAQIAKLYSSHRGFADTGYNSFPYNDYILRDQPVQAGVSVATVKSYIDTAIANKTWLVLTFHDIKTNASTNPDDYEYKTSDLDLIAAYIKSKNVVVVNINDGLAGGTNLLPNSSFDNGLADGWTTDGGTAVIKNTANNGSFPSATSSISMTATTKNIHLFSSQVAVDSGNSYFLKSFINLTKISSGSVGFYIDEYDVSGNWISGQYKLNVNFAWPQTVGFEYKPSSVNVKKARVQIIVPAGSGIQAYIDNFQWIASGAVVPIPSPTPVPSTNLMPNSTFDSGMASGWTTDSATNITKDTAGNGSPANPVNSIKMVATTKNIHLFAPKIAVTSGTTYTINSYLNIKQITSGVIGYYIDEYDAAGNWLSGQYKLDRNTLSAGNVSFQYLPSSASVKQASLQIIVVANSGLLAYIDDVQWLRPN